MFTANRKDSYKLPPTTIRDKLVSQEARRNQALDEQKRRRAQKVDSSRQLDLFADLTLTEHSDEELPIHAAIEDEDAISDATRVAAGSVAAYAAMLQQGDNENNEITSVTPLVSESPMIPEFIEPSKHPPDPKKPRRRGGKNSHKRRAEANKASNSSKYKAGSSQWADKCMYAELLEMNGDDVWDANAAEGQASSDGLPSDLEHGWVAVAPVPKGKRCLVVTHQSAGVAGVVPNTTLRSRLLGKSLLSRFPSPLPPLTVLDCILDEHWRENGILHVLDVVRWKGQDIADCEAKFRFWWRDTRIAELAQGPAPTFQFVAPSPATPITPPPSNGSKSHYSFPYPNTFIPVPYYSNTTLTDLDTLIIPAARSVRRVVPVTLPAHPFEIKAGPSTLMESGEMDVEAPSDVAVSPPVPATATVQPDGLLLYVAEASYEPGTSPLSSWIPIEGYDDATHGGDSSELSQTSRPLDLFQSLVQKRITRAHNGIPNYGVTVGGVQSSTLNGAYALISADDTMEL